VRKPFYLILLSGSTLLTGGCAIDGVQAWERQDLAKREMSIINEPLETATDDHIYFSKEASSGGQSFGGGGCGCN
jgi:hypothetical protein